MNKTTFTLAEAAELLHCHKETLRRAIQEGSLRAARLGREYRISRNDLETFWAERGGGALFGPYTPVEERPAEESAVKKRGRAKEKVQQESKEPDKPTGPQQLTLPT